MSGIISNARRYWTIIKLFVRYVRFQFRQARNKTNEFYEARTTYGPIKGVKRISCWNTPYYSFEKIPFAKPPLGDLRFRAPVPPEPWTEVKDCTKEGSVPFQCDLITKRIAGSEDCLYLNVYTNNPSPAKPYPVMVWIYGGGFECGGATKAMYGPDYFIERDVVLITINYRVGPLGFLSFKDPDINIPGNAGLKDQVLALKWVKSNCHYFGGDPDNITIFGESAGGASIQYMMITEQTKELFHKAIIMSGSVLCPWASYPSIRPQAYRLAERLGYKGSQENDKEIYNFIKNTNNKKLHKVLKDFLTPEEHKKCVVISFHPVVEPYISKDCVIPEDPRLMMRNCWTNKIPILIGGTSYEGLLFYSEYKKRPSFLNNLGNCTDLVPQELGLDDNSTECLDYGLKLRKMYFKGEQPNIQQLHQFLELLSDKMFWHALYRTVLSRIKYAKGIPTYLYRFDVDSKDFNLLRLILCGSRVRGCCHADDLGFLFYNMWAPDLDKNSPEYQILKEFSAAFVEFAKSGNPNHKEYKNEVIWRAVKKDDNEDVPIECLNFSYDTKMIPLPENEKLKVWDSFYTPEKLI